MEIIKNWFINNMKENNQDYEIDDGYDGLLEVKTDIAIFLIVEPHSGTEDKWLLRIAPISSFDRWANSTIIEEFFISDIELYNYLCNNQLNIYKALLKGLSNDYDLLLLYDEVYNKSQKGVNYGAL